MTNKSSIQHYVNPLECGVELGTGALSAIACSLTCCSSHDLLHNMATGVGIVGGFCFGRSLREDILHDYDSTRKDRSMRGAVRSLAYVGILATADLLTQESTSMIKQALPLWSDSWRYALGFLGGAYIGNMEINRFSTRPALEYDVIELVDDPTRKRISSVSSIPEHIK